MKDLKISQLPNSGTVKPEALIPIVLDGNNVTITPEQLYRYIQLLPVADVECDPTDVFEITQRGYYRLGKIQTLKVTISKSLASEIRFIAMPNTTITINDVEYKQDNYNESFKADTMYRVSISIGGLVTIYLIEEENIITL